MLVSKVCLYTYMFFKHVGDFVRVIYTSFKFRQKHSKDMRQKCSSIKVCFET